MREMLCAVIRREVYIAGTFDMSVNRRGLS